MICCEKATLRFLCHSRWSATVGEHRRLSIYHVNVDRLQGILDWFARLRLDINGSSKQINKQIKKNARAVFRHILLRGSRHHDVISPHCMQEYISAHAMSKQWMRGKPSLRLSLEPCDFHRMILLIFPMKPQDQWYHPLRCHEASGADHKITPYLLGNTGASWDTENRQMVYRVLSMFTRQRAIATWPRADVDSIDCPRRPNVGSSLRLQ